MDDWKYSAIQYKRGPDGERCQLCHDLDYTLEIPIDRERCDVCKKWFDFPKGTPYKERPVQQSIMYAFCGPCREENVAWHLANDPPTVGCHSDNDWEGLRGRDYGTRWERGLYRG